jgi:hypothetical protein
MGAGAAGLRASKMSSEKNPPFQSRWASATAGDAAALDSLAVSFLSPVYAWLRASGASAEDASQRARDFFDSLQSEPLRDEEKTIPRFSEFLLQRLMAFAAASHPKSRTPRERVLDFAQAERRFAKEPTRSAADVFARRWSMTMLEGTLGTLRAEWTAKGEGNQFPHLVAFLGFEGGGEEKYAELAPKLNMSVSVLHLAVYNFRRRYREVLRATIADTVREAGDVDNELTLLLCAAG